MLLEETFWRQFSQQQCRSGDIWDRLDSQTNRGAYLFPITLSQLSNLSPPLTKKQHPLLKPPRQCHKKAEQLENFAVAVRCDGCSRGEDPGAEQGPSEINIPLA